MKLTTERLKKLIREEMESVIETMTSKKSGIEKVKDPETDEIIMIDHDNEMITVLDKNSKPTGMKYVYEPDFATASPKGYIRIDEPKFNKMPKNLGI